MGSVWPSSGAFATGVEYAGAHAAAWSEGGLDWMCLKKMRSGEGGRSAAVSRLTSREIPADPTRTALTRPRQGATGFGGGTSCGVALAGGNIATTSSRRLAGKAAPRVTKGLMPRVAWAIERQAAA